MGRTLPTYRWAMEIEIAGWKAFQKSLTKKKQILFQQCMDQARKHSDAGSLAARPLVMEPILMSIGLSQWNRLEKLEDKIDRYLHKISCDSSAIAD